MFRPLAIVQVSRIEQAAQIRHVAAIAVIQQFIDVALALSMHQQVFQLDQPRQVDLQLRVAPAGGLAHVLAGEAHFRTRLALRLGTRQHQVAHQHQQLARLRRRPEVKAVESELEANGYAAVPSWRNDGRWELWTREVVTVAPAAGTAAPGRVHFTCGPSETFATRDAALAAGRAWRNTQQP